MPDITMCTNNECGLSNHCWRFTCKPKAQGQKYQRFEHTMDEETGEMKCKKFMYLPELSESEINALVNR